MELEFSQQLLDYPYADFKKHLKKANNNRILFSGKFGIGKSFFLNFFFDEETQSKKEASVSYETFHIYPVNYSIASNEDVFRYIKYDVITTMLLKNIQSEEVDLRYLDTLPEYLKGNLMKVLATLIYMIPKVGKDLYGSYEKLEALRLDFLKHHKEYKGTEGDKLVNFLERIENREGSVFENDIITKLICNVLTRLKQESKRETVLIIDDMDRIDPEHVFRLLNVFAAHLDNPNNLSNKLGFDKVIIVCDIQNLRNIFKAKYGAETDFNGYIDKFYSYDVYPFDNKAVLHNIAYEAFKSVTITGTDKVNAASHRSVLFNSHCLALDLCEMLIYNGFLSLRNLLARLNDKVEIVFDKVLRFDDLSTVLQSHIPQLTHFKILKEFVGGYDVLKDYLNKIPNRAFTIKNMYQEANVLMCFVHYEQTFRVDGTVTIYFNNKELAMRTSVKLRDNLKNLVVYEPKTNMSYSQPDQYKFTTQEFKTLLSDFIDLLKRIDN